jgi:outer membrane biosynthesis protein TonB
MSNEHHQKKETEEHWETPRQERAREAKEERAREAEQKEQPSVEPLAITVGAAIPPATTIDALFTSLFATRSADITAAGTPIYSWGKDNMIIAQWPSIQVAASGPANFSAMFCRFEARSVMGSQIAQ